jgi:hypothetical protein
MESTSNASTEGPRFRRTALGALAFALALGCASGERGVIDPRVSALPNPPEGPALRVAVVHDRREFRRNPHDSWKPSLYGEEIDDPAQTSRALARRSAENGGSGGNIWLPEGRSVAGLVEEVVARGFRAAGYRMLAAGDPGFERAPPVEIEVQQLWGRMRQQQSVVRFEFEARLRIRAPVPPFERGATVCSSHFEGSGGPGAGPWRRTFANGLEQLAGEIHAALASGAPPRYCARPAPGV